ncbi:MAG: hypothetical protein AAF415_09555 [Pseudomonadota bacterium]
MPNFDGGHYFLTTLAPIKVNKQPGDEPSDPPRESYVTKVQRALAHLPTAQQSPATIEIAKNNPAVISPFAKTPRTHLGRFVVIDDAIYNGRNKTDAILSSIGVKPQPTVPQEIDKLPCPYLMFCVDFDAVMTPGDPLPHTLSESEQNKIRDAYLMDLWEHSSAELSKIYENCQGFEGVKTPEDFAKYIARCQIETWMPFNDYYIGDELTKLPEIPLDSIISKVKFLGIAGVAALAFGIFDGILRLIFDVSIVGGMFNSIWAVVVGIVLLLILWFYIKGVYNSILTDNQKPWAAAEFGDLPSVLKGLYIQQRFSDFVIANQGKTPQQLHDAFGAFLKEHDPSDVLEKTQPPGVIKS